MEGRNESNGLEAIKSESLRTKILKADAGLNAHVKEVNGKLTLVKKHPQIMESKRTPGLYFTEVKFVIDDLGKNQREGVVDLYRGAKGRTDMNVGYIKYLDKETNKLVKSSSKVLVCPTPSKGPIVRNAFIKKDPSKTNYRKGSAKPKAEAPVETW